MNLSQRDTRIATRDAGVAAHAAMEVSAAPESSGTLTNGVAGGERACAYGRKNDRIGALWRKATRAGEQVLAKFGVSVRDQASAAVIHLADGRDIEIRRHGDKSCIGSAQWNGKPLDRCWLRHGEIAAGGVLEFLMTDGAGDWGRKGCL